MNRLALALLLSAALPATAQEAQTPLQTWFDGGEIGENRLSDTHWEYANMEVSYAMVDLNGDGEVSRSELIGMLEGGKLRPQAPEGYEGVTMERGLSARRAERFEHADSNGDGGVDLQEMMVLRREFVAANGKQVDEARIRRQAKQIIGRLDTNDDGRISRDELAQARGTRAMREMDKDGNGIISRAEWPGTD